MKMKEGMAWQANKLARIRASMVEIEKGIAKLEAENKTGYVRDSLTGCVHDRLQKVVEVFELLGSGSVLDPKPKTSRSGLFGILFGG